MKTKNTIKASDKIMSDNILNSKNYIFSSYRKNKFISSFQWFKFLSVASNFFSTRFFFVFIIITSLSLFIGVVNYLLGIFVWLIFIGIFIFDNDHKFIIKELKNIFKIKNPVLDTQSYFISKNISDNKVIFGVMLVSFFPFVVSYLVHLIFFINWLTILVCLGLFIFMTTKKFKKIVKFTGKFRVMNILLFPIFLIIYLIILVYNKIFLKKNNYEILIKKPSYNSNLGFSDLGIKSAENKYYKIKLKS